MAHKLSLSWLENFPEEDCESLRENIDTASVELAGYLKEFGYE